MTMPGKSVLIMAGGTGGHVYPALAIAEYLRGQGVQPFWLGTRAGLESRVVPENGIRLFTVNIGGLRGKRLSRRLLAPAMLIVALWQSLGIILKLSPSAVIGLGGFVSGPGGIAAWLLRKPLLIHEQNSIAGLTNRLLAPFARVIMLGFPGALQGKKVVATGNPVRRDILAKAIPAAERLMGREQQSLRLLVLGGSLGARALNEILPPVISTLPGDVRIDVWHQTGRQHYETTVALYDRYGVPAEKVMPYIEDMAEAYAWADLVLCRAGALTVSEISVIGVASILVPYPHAVDDHQTVNARYLCEAGGAVIVPEPELNVPGLADLLCGFHRQRGRLVEMATAVQRRAFSGATADIGRLCLEVVNA